MSAPATPPPLGILIITTEETARPGVVRQNSISEMTSGALCGSVYTAETAPGERSCARETRGLILEKKPETMAAFTYVPRTHRGTSSGQGRTRG